MSEYSIEGDSELKQMVRGLTHYADHEEELPDDVLETQIKVSKLRLKNKTNIDLEGGNFYDDDGIAQALLFTTCILAKCAAENYSIDRWDIGGSHIEARYAAEPDQIQFQQWAELVAEGLKNSEETTAGPLPRVTRSYPP